MKVKCINKISRNLNLEHSFEPSTLEIGREYNVYGFEVADNDIYVYISDFETSSYPSIYSLQYFEIISGKLSKHWHLNLKGEIIQFVVMDWVRFPDFMRLYIDSYEPNPELYGLLDSFYEWKQRIDNEIENEEL